MQIPQALFIVLTALLLSPTAAAFPGFPLTVEFEYCPTGDPCRIAYWFLEEDGTFEDNFGVIGEWIVDTESRRIQFGYFDYDAWGLVYRGDIVRPWCAEGEIIDLQPGGGVVGVWSGCVL